MGEESSKEDALSPLGGFRGTGSADTPGQRGDGERPPGSWCPAGTVIRGEQRKE